MTTRQELAERAMKRLCSKTVREWAPGKFMFCGQLGRAHRSPSGEPGTWCQRHVPEGWEESPCDAQWESELLVDWVHDL